VKLEKKVESPDHASGFPFFSKVFKSLPAILGMAKMCQRFKKLVPNLSSYISGWWFQANLNNTPRNGSSLERPGQK